MPPYRLTKIYTRKGDKGLTHFGGKRLPKDDLHIEIIGTLDELNSMIGFARTFATKNEEIESLLHRIQNQLFDFGGELHAPQHQKITAESVKELENYLDKWNNTLPPLKEFLLPGGNSKAAALHVARAVCRRAERNLVHLHHQDNLQNPQMLCYLNRLSDLLFVVARLSALETHPEEKLWEHV